jgi:hypothetical protein
MDLLAAVLLAGDVSGIWTGQIAAGRQGATIDIAFQLIQQGNQIRGKLYGDYRSGEIVEGRVEDGEIWFVVLSPDQAGNEINQARLRFAGCIDNETLNLTRTREASARAVSGAAAPQSRPQPPIEFMVKRLVPAKAP